MKLKIQIKDNFITIGLISGNKIVDQIVLKDINNLSERLLLGIDKLLTRNKISLNSIQKIDSKIDLPESYTASRIVEAVVKGLEFSKAKL